MSPEERIAESNSARKVLWGIEIAQKIAVPILLGVAGYFFSWMGGQEDAIDANDARLSHIESTRFSRDDATALQIQWLTAMGEIKTAINEAMARHEANGPHQPIPAVVEDLKDRMGRVETKVDALLARP